MLREVDRIAEQIHFVGNLGNLTTAIRRWGVAKVASAHGEVYPPSAESMHSGRESPVDFRREIFRWQLV